MDGFLFIFQSVCKGAQVTMEITTLISIRSFAIHQEKMHLSFDFSMEQII